MHASSAPNEPTMARSVREEMVLAMGGKRYKNVFSALSRHNEENECSRATRGNNVSYPIHASNASNAQFKNMCAREPTVIPMSRRRCENISSASKEQTKRMGAHEQHINTSGCTESVDRVQVTNGRRHGVFEKRRFLQLPANNVRTYRVHQANATKSVFAREQPIERTCSTRFMHRVSSTDTTETKSARGLSVLLIDRRRCGTISSALNKRSERMLESNTSIQFA